MVQLSRSVNSHSVIFTEVISVKLTLVRSGLEKYDSSIGVKVENP